MLPHTLGQDADGRLPARPAPANCKSCTHLGCRSSNKKARLDICVFDLEFAANKQRLTLCADRSSSSRMPPSDACIPDISGVAMHQKLPSAAPVSSARHARSCLRPPLRQHSRFLPPGPPTSTTTTTACVPLPGEGRRSRHATLDGPAHLPRAQSHSIGLELVASSSPKSTSQQSRLPRDSPTEFTQFTKFKDQQHRHPPIDTTLKRNRPLFPPVDGLLGIPRPCAAICSRPDPVVLLFNWQPWCCTATSVMPLVQLSKSLDMSHSPMRKAMLIMAPSHKARNPFPKDAGACCH